MSIALFSTRGYMIKLATKISYETCVGVYVEDYPVEWGNCFGVVCDDNSHYKIVNFALENLEELICRGVGWPFKIKLISDYHAVVHDERIPDDWYSNEFCTICCPKELLTVTQLLKHERQIVRGERQEGNGYVKYDFSKRVILPV